MINKIVTKKNLKALNLYKFNKITDQQFAVIL